MYKVQKQVDIYITVRKTIGHIPDETLIETQNSREQTFKMNKINTQNVQVPYK